MNVGDPIPDFTFECTDPTVRSFKDVLAKRMVLYFYPKDNTPGCTLEGKEFKNLYPSFLAHHTQIIGISRDPLSAHEKFSTKYALPFPLIADPDERLCKHFGVLIERNMFKRIFLGVERSTFLIFQDRKVKHIWRNVRVKGHAKEVLSILSLYPS